MPLSTEEVKHVQDSLSDVSDMPETQQAIAWIDTIYSSIREHKSSKQAVESMEKAHAALPSHSILYAAVDEEDEDGAYWDVSFNIMFNIGGHNICTSVYIDQAISRCRIDAKEVTFFSDSDRDAFYTQSDEGEDSFEKAKQYVMHRAMLQSLLHSVKEEND